MNEIGINNELYYSTELLKSVNENDNDFVKNYNIEFEEDEIDPFLLEAIECVIETGQATTSFIQRRFKVGYARAGRIIDQMKERGIISGYMGSKPRDVLITLEEWNKLKNMKGI